MVIHGRHPERPRRHDLGGLFLFLLAGDLDHQIERVEQATAVVEHGDKVRVILVLLTIDCIGNREAQVMVLDVANHLAHVFESLGHLLFPTVGVGNDVRDVAPVGAGRVDRPGRVEVDIAGRANGVIGPEDRPERRRTVRRPVRAAHDRAINSVGGIVGEL